MSLFGSTEDFKKVRKKLDELGFNQPLGFESIALVEALIDSIYNLKSIQSKAASPSPAIQTKDELNISLVIDAYKSENARLQSFNNEMRLKLLEDDSNEENILDLKQKIRSLELNDAKLRFLNNQYVTKIVSMEKEATIKNELLNKLQNSAQTVIQVENPKRKVQLKHQKLEMKYMIVDKSSRMKSSNVMNQKGNQCRNPYVADMLKLADQRMCHLESDNESLKKKYLSREVNINHLEDQVSKRNEEIKHLQGLLLKERNPNHLSIEFLKKTYEEKIGNLEMQLEVLQNKSLNPSQRNVLRSKSDKDVERNIKISRSEKNLDDIQSSAKRFIVKNSSNDQVLLKDNKKLKETIKKLKEKESESEVTINRLISNENELLHEIDRLVSLVDSSEVGSDVGKTLKKACKFKDEESCVDKINRLEHERDSLMRNVTDLKRIVSNLQSNKDDIEELKNKLELTQNDKRVVEKMHNDLKSIISSSTIFKTMEDKEELTQFDDLKKQYKSVLEKYKRDMENELSEIHKNKDSFMLEKQKILNELREMQNDSRQVPMKADMSSSLLQDLVSQIKKKDEIIEKLIADKNEMKDDIIRMSEIDKLTTSNAETTSIKTSQNNEMLEMEVQLESYKKLVIALEEQVAEKQAQLLEAYSQKEERKSPLREPLNSPSIPSKISDENNAAKKAYDEELSIKNNLLQQEILVLREKVTAISSMVSKLDKEKDAIQTLLDNKTENLVKLKNKSLTQIKEVSCLKITVASLEHELEQEIKKNSNKEQECAEFRHRLSLTLNDVAFLKESNNKLESINQQLSSDLNAMTKECQSISVELMSSNQELNRLKFEVKDYLTELKRVEEVLAAKEQESHELLEEFGNIKSEASSLKSQINVQQTESNNAKMELFSADSENRQLQDTVYKLERELEDRESSNHQYETEIGQLLHTLNSTEGELELSQADVDKLTEALHIERDLTSDLKKEKIELVAELSTLNSSLHEANLTLRSKNDKISIIESELASKNETIAALEELLTEKREQEHEAEKSTETLFNEIHLLRQKLAETEIKLNDQSQDLSKFQNEAAKLDADTERLKRQLLNERFERERAVQKALQLKCSDRSSIGNNVITSVQKEILEDPNSVLSPSARSQRSFDSKTQAHSVEAKENFTSHKSFTKIGMQSAEITGSNSSNDNSEKSSRHNSFNNGSLMASSRTLSFSLHMDTRKEKSKSDNVNKKSELKSPNGAIASPTS